MKIKDNLDLQGYLLQNFCVDNYDSLDSISNKGDGRMVFLTGNSTDAKYRHVNVWDGTNFKALAYLEDVAMNDDFIALQEKVDSIDEMLNLESSQTVIDTWEEVKAFLNSVPEGLELMGLLNSKLDKTGGTISGGYAPLVLNRTDGSTIYVTYRNSSKVLGYLGFEEDGPAYTDTNWGIHKLLHSGNYSDYALPLSGGKMSGTLNWDRHTSSWDDVPEGFKAHTTYNESDGYYSGLSFKDYYGFQIRAYGGEEHNIQVRGMSSSKVWGNWRTVIDSANIGSYKAGDSAKLGGYDATVYPTFENAATCIGFNLRASYQSLGQGDGHIEFYDGAWYNSMWGKVTAVNGFVGTLTGNASSATQLATARTIWGQSFDGTGNVSGNLYLGTGTIRSSKSGTDRVFLDFGSAGDPYLGYGTASAGIDSHLCGNNIYLRYGTSRTKGLILNSSGNVTIGAQDSAGTSAKLFVDGATFVNSIKSSNQHPTLGNAGGGGYLVIGNLNLGLELWTRSDGHSALQAHRLNGTAEAFNLFLQPLGGNVLIGTTINNGAKLQVNGSATITATGDNTEILRFGTDRAWAFYQVDSGAGASLQLRALSKGKSFSIGRDDGSQVFSVNTAASSAVVTSDASIFPLSNNTYRLGAFDSRWSTIYSVNGNFSGNIEATGFISTKDRLEVYGSQPYIDFHHGNSTEDYTTRLIEQTKGTLKLVGNLHVSGNIIADGEVSAGGAAEEGGNAGGGGAFHSESIAVGATQTTIAHGLGTDDIVVSIYEKDATSGLWSMILTDIEITDANNIRVTFGSATTVEHKVVIMGAVA